MSFLEPEGTDVVVSLSLVAVGVCVSVAFASKLSSPCPVVRFPRGPKSCSPSEQVKVIGILFFGIPL